MAPHPQEQTGAEFCELAVQIVNRLAHRLGSPSGGVFHRSGHLINHTFSRFHLVNLP